MKHLNLLTAAQYKLEVLEVTENEIQPDGGCQNIVLWSLTAMDEKNKKKERKKEFTLSFFLHSIAICSDWTAEVRLAVWSQLREKTSDVRALL